MKVDIGKAIRLVLEERHVASIPGLGTFRINVKPARLNAAGNMIEPPNSNLVFDEQSINDHSLVEFLSDYYGISRVKALKYLESFEVKLKSAIASNKSVRVKGLGLFKPSAKGMLFQPIESISKSIFYGFKPTPTTLISPAVEEAKSDEGAESKIIETAVAKQSIEQPAEIETSSQLSNLKPAEPKPEVLEEKIEAPNIKTNTMADYNDPNYEKNHGYNSDYDGPSKWSYLLRPLLVLLGFLLISALLFKKCASWAKKAEVVQVVDEFDEQGQTTSGELKDNVVNTEGDQVSGEGGNQLNGEEDNQVEAFKNDAAPMFKANDGADVYKSGDLASQPLNCIIITGTFKKSSNIIKMIKKLEAMGYDSYTELTDSGLTRVGFFFQCKEEDLEKYIYNIRQEVSSAAWYLTPRIHVD